MAEQQSAFEILRGQLTHAHQLWKTYVYICIGPEAKADLMNAAAPEFFGLFQDMLVNQIVLSLFRLGDRSKSTLNFGTLLKQEKARLKPADYAKAEAKLKEYRAACKPVENWRHGFIAHLSFKVAMGLEPLGSFSGADTVKALALGVEFLRLIKPKDHWTYDYEIPAMKKILVACVQARRYINDHRKDGELLKVHEELRRIEKGTDKRADT